MAKPDGQRRASLTSADDKCVKCLHQTSPAKSYGSYTCNCCSAASTALLGGRRWFDKSTSFCWGTRHRNYLAVTLEVIDVMTPDAFWNASTSMDAAPRSYRPG